MPAPNPLSAWNSFYVIVGSSAAALTGLQFVVVALINDSEIRSGRSEFSAFSTPTIVHFSAALLVAAVASAPWPSLFGPSVAFTACGAIGVVYAAITAIRATRGQQYEPVLEDWIWHVALPFIAYVATLAGGALLQRHLSSSLFAIAAASLLLLFVGIHNAWDTVTYVAFFMPRSDAQTTPPPTLPTPSGPPSSPTTQMEGTEPPGSRRS